VPWQLKSSERVAERTELTPGAYRRGYPSAPRDDRPAAPSPASVRARAEAGDGSGASQSAGSRTEGTRAGVGRPRS